MTAHEVVIRFGHPFDVQLRGTHSGVPFAFTSTAEITVPFSDRESAEAAQREITVHVRQVHDAGGEDYRPVVAGEVVREPAEIEPDTGTHCRVYWGSHGCCHPRGHPPEVPHACDCCDCPGKCRPSCVAKPPYYGDCTAFYGEEAEALGLPGYEDGEAAT